MPSDNKPYDGTKPLPKPMLMKIYMSPYGLTKHQWVKQKSSCKGLTHWGRVAHICIFGSDNGLSPGRGQAIIWTNAVILLIEPLGTNFSEILIKIDTFSLKKFWEMSVILSRPQCVNTIFLSVGYMAIRLDALGACSGRICRSLSLVVAPLLYRSGLVGEAPFRMHWRDADWL